jgi:hypothetical protein
LFITPPLPDGARITGVEVHEGEPPVIERNGASLRVRSIPFSAKLTLGSAIA